MPTSPTMTLSFPAIEQAGVASVESFVFVFNRVASGFHGSHKELKTLAIDPESWVLVHIYWYQVLID